MLYTIGPFAALTGLTARALRFYDQLGLLPAHRDPTNGHRYYTEADRAPARRIALLRALGFGVSDVRDLLEVLGDDDEAAQLEAAFRAQLQQVRAERAAIQRREAVLGRVLRLLEASSDAGAELRSLAELDPDHRREMMHALQTESATLSARGARPTNQDRSWLQPLPGGVLAIVADGTGPGARGSDASARATEVFAEHLDPDALTPGGFREHLDAVVARVQEAVQAQAVADAVVGTTLTALILRDGMAYLAHVGDSRVYEHTAAALTLRTRDHTHVQEQVEAGALAPEDAWSHPERHLLTSMLGAEPLSVHLACWPVPPSARYLLVTDGVTRAWRDVELGEVLAEETEADAAVARLVAREGDDNATALIVTS